MQKFPWATMLTTSSNSNTPPWASHSLYPMHPLNIPPNNYPQLPLLASLRPGGNFNITFNNSFSPLQTSGLNSNHLVTFSATPDLEFWPCHVLDSLTSLWPHEHFPCPVLGSISPHEHQVLFWLSPLMNLTSGWFIKVTLAGIEPATFWLCMWCSTHWAKVSIKLWNRFKVSRLQPRWFELAHHPIPTLRC